MPSDEEKNRKSGPEGQTAREHSKYAGDDGAPESRPREEGDYLDPGKRLTGRGNASKGPWKDQGGAGHGEDYGARDKDKARDATKRRPHSG